MNLTQFAVLMLVLILVGCSGKGRVVEPEELTRFEHGGSMSTLWYYGCDKDYHYFRHLFKTSTPYRVPKSELLWPSEIRFEGYDKGKGHLVVREISSYLKSKSNAVPRLGVDGKPPAVPQPPR